MIVNLHESINSYPSKKSYQELEGELHDLKIELLLLKSDYKITKNFADMLEKAYLKPKKSWSIV